MSGQRRSHFFLPKFAEHRKTGAPPGALTGAGSRNRTHDQRFTKPLLYQLSYAGASLDFTRANAAQAKIGNAAPTSATQGTPREDRDNAWPTQRCGPLASRNASRWHRSPASLAGAPANTPLRPDQVVHHNFVGEKRRTRPAALRPHPGRRTRARQTTRRRSGNRTRTCRNLRAQRRALHHLMICRCGGRAFALPRGFADSLLRKSRSSAAPTSASAGAVAVASEAPESRATVNAKP